MIAIDSSPLRDEICRGQQSLHLQSRASPYDPSQVDCDSTKRCFTVLDADVVASPQSRFWSGTGGRCGRWLVPYWCSQVLGTCTPSRTQQLGQSCEHAVTAWRSGNVRKRKVLLLMQAQYRGSAATSIHGYKSKHIHAYPPPCLCLRPANVDGSSQRKKQETVEGIYSYLDF